MFFKILATRRLREKRSTEEIRSEIEHHRQVEHAAAEHPRHSPPSGE